MNVHECLEKVYNDLSSSKSLVAEIQRYITSVEKPRVVIEGMLQDLNITQKSCTIEYINSKIDSNALLHIARRVTEQIDGIPVSYPPKIRITIVIEKID